MTRKDLRGREALRQSPELAAVAGHPVFDAVEITDLRKLAELLRDHASGSPDLVTMEAAAAFGGTSRHRFESARRALCALVGEDHPATRSVTAALSSMRNVRRRGTRHRDHRTREAILHAARWASFRAAPAAQALPLQELRAVDRFLAFCERSALPPDEIGTFLAFVGDKESSMLLRTLREGLEALLTPAHPAVVAAERARSLKETERYERRKPATDFRRLPAVSVPFEDLPADWQRLLDALTSGKRVGRRKFRPRTVQGMTEAVRQFVWASRAAGLPDGISLETIGAYDRALEAREVRAGSRQMLFASLRMFASILPVDEELLADLRDLCAHYEKRATCEVKLKEDRLVRLPELQAIFDKANALLDEAETTTDRRRRTTLYVDAAALAFLSLIPLRNQDTCLFWGRHITCIGSDPEEPGAAHGDAPPVYYIDLRTSKTDEALSGPLSPILTPFLDALILLGQDERLLPDLRRAAMATQSPVFPRSNGEPRRARSLSERWRKHTGTGSIISRTRIHTFLGSLGEAGVEAALALCAQRSPRTARWYQAQALFGRRMVEGQRMLTGLIELDEEDCARLSGL